MCPQWQKGVPMLTVDARGANGRADLTRRDFLRVGGLGAASLALAEPRSLLASPSASEKAVILLLLVGGPSQLDTWDPKPEAPEDVRGPYKCIETSVPGLRISEHMPRLARLMDRLTL